MASDKFVLLGTEIKKGKGAVLELEVAKLHTRNSLKVPVIIERGKKDGPVLLLLGGVHGDESNGVAIVRDIIRKKYHKPKRGTVICIPVFNVFGYLNLTRAFPDGRDLNRMFPGSKRGSLASQFAYTFTKEIAPYVDYVVDFHTGGADRSNYPNIRCNFNEEEEFALAKAFGAPYMMHSKYIHQSIRETIHKLGKPIILFEGGKSLDLDKEVIKIGVDGALNVMKHLNMHDGEVEVIHKPVYIKKSKWLRAPFSGMFESMVNNGDHVSKKQLIGRISDPFGEFEKKIYAPSDCYIFGLNTAPNVNKGDAIYHVSVQHD